VPQDRLLLRNGPWQGFSALSAEHTRSALHDLATGHRSDGKISFVFYDKVDNDPGSERIPDSVGQAAFIIGASRMGALEAKKILSDTDHEGSGMYLRINQFSAQCAVDASIARYAHAERT